MEDGQEIDEELRRKEKGREMQRAIKNLDPREFICKPSNYSDLEMLKRLR